MSFEINPVLAGTFDAPDYAPAQNNLATTTSNTGDVSGPDPRRYTQFDRSAIDGAGSTTDFSFSDLVDMLNPLEHIPVVSSVYRAITGDSINPVSRVAGDIIYGGVFGGASAALGGIGAVADAGLEAETGKDSGGLVISALFGPDDQPATTRLADAGNAANPAATSTTPAPKNIELTQAASVPSTLAALEVPADAPAAATPLPAPAAVAAVPVPPAPVSGPTLPTTVASGTNTPSLGAAAPEGTIPLASPSSPSKLPFGGIMDPNPAPGGPTSLAAVQAGAVGKKTTDTQSVALTQGSPGMRMGHTIYTSRLVNGPHPLPPMLSSGASPASATVATPPPVSPAASANPVSAAQLSALMGGGMSTPLPQSPALSPGLMQDMMLKALSQYGNVAAGPAASGGLVNLSN